MKNMNRPDINDKKLGKHNYSQIYTLSHAVRSKRKVLDRENIAKSTPKKASPPKVKEELKKRVKNTLHRQSRSHLPMNMIVSKMATRQHFNKENEDTANKLDLSMCRKYPLEPPPWRRRNSLCSTKRQRPTELEKIVSEMKKKKSELDSSSQYNYSTVLKDQTTLDRRRLQNLLLNGNPQGCSVLNTPSLEYNYNQLYGGCKRTTENHTPAVLLDEDPLSINATDQRALEEDHFTINSRPPTPKSLPQVVPDIGKPDFVWNPVIVKEPKTQLFDCIETVTSKQLCSSPYEDREDLQSYFSTPAHESSSSSSSSDHIVTEETIEISIFSKHGNLSMFDHEYLSRFPQSPNNSWD